MAYNTRSVRRNKLPYQVLKEICLEETEQGYELRKQGNYSSNIAKTLDTDQSLISEIISQLQELNLVFKGERKRAQYYKINPLGFGQFVVDNLLEKTIKVPIAENQVDLSKTKYESVEEMIDSLIEYKEDLSQRDEENESKQLMAFIFYFSVYYFQNYERSTIDEMLLRDLPSGIKSKTHSFMVFDWYAWLYELSILFKGIRDPGYITSKAFGELEAQGIIDLSEDKIKDISSSMRSIEDSNSPSGLIDLKEILDSMEE